MLCYALFELSISNDFTQGLPAQIFIVSGTIRSLHTCTTSTMLLPAMSALTWVMCLRCPVLASPAPTFDSLDGRPTAAAETGVRTSLTYDAVTPGHTGVANMLNNLIATTSAVPTTLTTATASRRTTATKTVWGDKPEPTGITDNPSYCRYRQKYGPWQVYLSTCK